ncbi:ABC transporter permease [Streptomyces sp. CAU 1734]|uniref:ABC transporter permease n=1 Tax=Streptomyces sp. CAU 1734 TaxID=3140360 RepID=UPI003261BD54
MSIASAPATTAARPSFPAVFGSALRSEWRKIVSVPSQCVALVAVLAAGVGFSLLMSGTFTARDMAEPGFDPVRSAFYGLNFAQIGALCFGAVAVAGEYRNHAIRVSLAAVPRRGVLYGAKITVIGGVLLAVGLLTAIVCHVTGQTLMGTGGVALTDPVALRAVLGFTVHLALMGLFAAGVGMVLRSAPGTIGILVPVLFMLSFVFGDLDEGAGPADFLPDRAGQQMLLQEPTGPLGPWSGLGVLVLWAAAVLWAGWWALRRRDA